MASELFPQDNVFWYLKKTPIRRLKRACAVDVVVIGGGMAGLSAAQSFHNQGLTVALLEKNYCGAGASGKSSGFITPDSEFSLSDFARVFGPVQAERFWEFVLSGVALIQKNITDFSLDCDYQAQDTVVVATSKKLCKSRIQKEYDTRLSLSYEATLYARESVSTLIGSDAYYGAIRYGGTFGIDAYRYCQGMKNILQDAGVAIYEETPVTRFNKKGVDTVYGSVSADHVIVCMDRFIPDLGALKYELYHAQTFLMLSAPLSDNDVHRLFPSGSVMVWDTDLVYNYYRLTGEQRLMLGGGSLFSLYAGQEQHNNKRVFRKLNTYFEQKFPDIKVHFEYMWPGLIGLSKDILPIAGADQTSPWIYYVGAAAGLPWAAALGIYSAESVLNKRNDLDAFFSPYRKFALGPWTQRIIGTPLTFALSNFMRVGTL